MIIERMERSDSMYNDRFEQINHRFLQVDKRFEQVDKRLDQVDKLLEQVDKRFEAIDRRFIHLTTLMMLGFGFVSGLIAALKFLF